MKTVKERDDLDLLTLVCELHARSLMYMTKELHDANVEARQELESRIIVYQNLIKADVSGSLGFDEGYSKGYSDAQREAAQEIREHYHPNCH